MTEIVKTHEASSIDATKPLRLVLEILPHGTSRRCQQQHPKLDRVLDAKWWTRALWGEAGLSDPMPEVRSVVEVPEGATVSFDITGTQLAADIKAVDQAMRAGDAAIAKRGPARPRKGLPAPGGDPEC